MLQHLIVVFVAFILCDIYRKLCVMPGPIPPKTHTQARWYCCATCGRGKAELAVTLTLESLIKKFVHPTYDLNVETFPSGLCNTCKRSLYKCQTAENLEEPIQPYLQEAWAGFKLEDIRVPHTSAACRQCNCTMCLCAHFTCIGKTGSRKITTKPIVNPTGEPWNVRFSLMFQIE